MWTGIFFALAAGLMWGLVFVTPVLLPDYPAALLSTSRYLAFGLIALPLAWLDRRRLALLSAADWIEALKLSLVGNLVYYLCLAAAIQRAGAPLPTMIIGTLPVVIAICANLRAAGREPRLPWARLAPSLLLIAAGIACVNHAELTALRAGEGAPAASYALGVLLAGLAVVCWTWYPLRNADWLRAHADRSPRTWATAQGVATLPLALVGYFGFWMWTGWIAPLFGADGGAFAVAAGSPVPGWLGPDPLRYIGLMLAVGLFASWLGTLCWNEASQRLPPSLSGQLIVFETLAALAYAFMLRGSAPGALTMLGILLLVAGVFMAIQRKAGGNGHIVTN